MSDLNTAQVHRHARRVAIQLENQPTLYLTVNQAKGLAAALKACAKDVSEIETFTKSKFQTFRILP